MDGLDVSCKTCHPRKLLAIQVTRKSSYILVHSLPMVAQVCECPVAQLAPSRLLFGRMMVAFVHVQLC